MCVRLTLAIILLFLIISYSLIISRYFHYLWAELALGAAAVIWIGILIKKLRSAKIQLEHDKLQLDEYALALVRIDIFHYYKQIADLIFFLIPDIIIGIHATASFFLFSGDFGGEVSYQIALFASAFILFLIYLLGRTSLLFYCGTPYLDKKQRRFMNLELIRCALACLIYWAIASAFLMSGIVPFHRTRLLGVIFLIIYLIVGIIVNLRIRLFSFSRTSRTTVTVCTILIIVLSVVGLMYTEPDTLSTYSSSFKEIAYEPDEITYDRSNGNYVITTDKDDFRILQLSDIHLGGSRLSKEKDEKALEACYRLISDTKPDLVIITGDMVYSVGIQTLSFNNYTQIKAFCQFMNQIGIPWAFTYGNHDTEFFSTASKSEVDAVYQGGSFLNGGTMLYPDIKPDISGRCNQCIEIRNRDGSLRQALFLIDSNACSGLRANVYTGTEDDQIDWYEEKVNKLADEDSKLPRSIIYTHIPPYEMKEAYELYKLGSDEAELLSGQPAEGIVGDSITTQPRTCGLFNRCAKLGSTQAIFFGHDHFTTLNMEYRGIQLSYGMSIDYITRPKSVQNTYQRGGTIVALAPDGTYEMSQRLLVSCPSL